jgi:hypothetical protein
LVQAGQFSGEGFNSCTKKTWRNRMPKIPARPEEIFDDFAHDYQEAFGADLLSIILYGSGGREEYIYKKSDINFLVVLTEVGIEMCSKAIPLVSRWHKRRVSTPLLVTPRFIAFSVDTFPVELLNLKAAYKVVYGEDVLRDLAFDKKYVRLQCEREVRGKLLHLRKQFLETGGKWRKIEELIFVSLPSFFSLFRAVRFLEDKDPAVKIRALVISVCQDVGLDKDFFLELLAIREGRKKLVSNQAIPLMKRYAEEITKFSNFVGQMATA